MTIRKVLGGACYALALPFIVLFAIGFGLLDAFGGLVAGRG